MQSCLSIHIVQWTPQWVFFTDLSSRNKTRFGLSSPKKAVKMHMLRLWSVFLLFRSVIEQYVFNVSAFDTLRINNSSNNDNNKKPIYLNPNMQMVFFLGDLLQCPVGNLYLICNNGGMRWWICVRFYRPIWWEFECVSRNPMMFARWKEMAYFVECRKRLLLPINSISLLFDWKWNGASCRWHIQSLYRERQFACMHARLVRTSLDTSVHMTRRPICVPQKVFLTFASSGDTEKPSEVIKKG